MRGKVWSIPHGMMFRKYYCAKCGTKLETKRTHRVVSPGDEDYYQYNAKLTFPRPDYDVYSYKFKCPRCAEEISFDEQRIIETIQKKQGYRTLSSFDMKDYDMYKKVYYRKKLLSNILTIILSALIFTLIAFVFLHFMKPDRERKDFIIFGALILFSVISNIWREIKRYKANC